MKLAKALQLKPGEFITWCDNQYTAKASPDSWMHGHVLRVTEKGGVLVRVQGKKAEGWEPIPEEERPKIWVPYHHIT